MKAYFEKMTEFGQALNPGRLKSSAENVAQLKTVEAEIKAQVDQVKQAGFPEEKINARGQMTVFQRLRYLAEQVEGTRPGQRAVLRQALGQRAALYQTARHKQDIYTGFLCHGAILP